MKYILARVPAEDGKSEAEAAAYIKERIPFMKDTRRKAVVPFENLASCRAFADAAGKNGSRVTSVNARTVSERIVEGMTEDDFRTVFGKDNPPFDDIRCFVDADARTVSFVMIAMGTYGQSEVSGPYDAAYDRQKKTVFSACRAGDAPDSLPEGLDGRVCMFCDADEGRPEDDDPVYDGYEDMLSHCRPDDRIVILANRNA